MDSNDKREFPELSTNQRYDIHAALQNHDHEKMDQRAVRPGFRVAGTDPKNTDDLKDRKWIPATGPFDGTGLLFAARRRQRAIRKSAMQRLMGLPMLGRRK